MLPAMTHACASASGLRLGGDGVRSSVSPLRSSRSRIEAGLLRCGPEATPSTQQPAARAHCTLARSECLLVLPGRYAAAFLAFPRSHESVA